MNSGEGVEKLPRPLVIYDGACGFCRRAVRRWRSLTGNKIDYSPFQELSDPFAGVPHRQFSRSLHFLRPSGDISTGALAVFQALSDGAQRNWPLWLYLHLPGFSLISELCYRLVANHRTAASKLAALFWREEP